MKKPLNWTILLSWSMIPLLVALDQWSKMHVMSLYYVGESVPVVGNTVKLTYVHNAGAAFGVLQSFPGLFKTLTGTAIVLVSVYKHLTLDRSASFQYPLGLILAGAVGNMIDRLRFNYVIDFIDVGYGAHRWPAFNIADSCISVGVALLILLPLFTGRRADTPDPATSPAHNGRFACFL